MKGCHRATTSSENSLIGIFIDVLLNRHLYRPAEIRGVTLNTSMFIGFVAL